MPSNSSQFTFETQQMTKTEFLEGNAVYTSDIPKLKNGVLDNA